MSKLSVPTIINFVFSILRNKLLAIISGPFGLGIYSQLASILGLITVFLPIGGMGITRSLSFYFSTDDYSKAKYIIRYFLIRNSIASIFFSVIIIFFSAPISQFIYTDSSYSYLIVLLALTIPFSLFLNFIDIFLKSLRNINNYVKYLIISSLISIIITCPLIIFFGITGAVAAIIIQGLINTIMGMYLIYKKKLFPKNIISEEIEKKEITGVYKVGLGVLIVLIVQNLSFLLIKTEIAFDLGVAEVGMFQSIYSISFSYLGIFFTALSIYSMPKFSTFKLKSENNTEINNTLRLLILIFTPVLSIVFACRSLLITVLFSNDFLIVKDLLFFQLLGDFFRAFSWTFGLWLIPNLKIKQWIIFDLLFYSIFYLSSIVMLKYTSLGLQSVSIAYFISYLIHASVNCINTRKYLEFRFKGTIIKEFFISILIMLLILIVSYESELTGYIIILPLLLIWFFISGGVKLFNKFYAKK
ncbi:MAG: oligosaccharide flippase family protein [bacterium]